jgi:PAS domain S-box-containing protein
MTIQGHSLEGTSSSERALRASEARYRRLFESAKDGIVILEAETGRVIDVNPYLAQLLGYARADFIDKHLWDFGPFKDVVASKDAFETLQATDYVAYEDLPLERSDGARVDVGFVSNAYLVDGKRFIQCNIRDITQRKLDDQARRGLEDQLRAAQKLEAIGSLAGGMAHDFNNLLSVILCYCRFIFDALPEGSPTRGDLTEVRKASERAATLVQQLLAFSRKQVRQPVPLALNGVLEGFEPMLRRILGEDVELVLDLAPTLGTMMADASQIEQVVMNLVVNARDAMPGGGTLTLRTQDRELDAAYALSHVGVLPGHYVMFSVTDTGLGMDAPTRERVFEPFFTTKALGKGTGLGMSTVYGIVQQSGGNIWVYSEVDRGTAIHVYFPRLSALASDATVAPTRTASTRPRGTETILVVEDEEAVRNLAKRILSSTGYTVLTANDGREALELCSAYDGPIALALSDVVMPKMGGPAFAHELMRVRPSTKVVFMSGYSGDAVQHRGVLEAGTRFVEKPFTAAGLAQTIRLALDEVTSDASHALTEAE